MNAFISEHFLLQNETARRLYHDHAAALPIVDYHCHLDPRDLAADRRFENVAQLWVTGDPYKHRAMRIAGVPERLITGPASDREKFQQWAATVPQTLGNPLHHWTALELSRYFGIDEPLGPDSAERIWARCNERLRDAAFSARGLLRQRGVEVVCTSDRLLDDLSAHARLAQDGSGLRVLPSLRSDDIVAVESTDFQAWVLQLGAATNTNVAEYAGFLAAVGQRLDTFAVAGCRLADHGLDDLRYVSVAESEMASLYRRCVGGEALAETDRTRLRSGLLRALGAAYAKRGWILQLHLGAQRQTTSRLRRLVGPAGGYAGIGNSVDIPSLCRWLNDLESDGALPRTILYPLNPNDFVPLAVLAGSFVEDGVRGKVQLGPAWWFNDHAAGMRAQLEAIAAYGLLPVFIGMTTDSRSLLSMVRHEYFRRIFCDWVGDQVERGSMPNDATLLANLVRDVGHDNALGALGL